MKLLKNIFLFLFVTILLSCSNVFENLNETDSNERKILVFLSFIASLFIFISGIIFLFIAIKDEDLEVELAFN